jgi:hypothetical protein
MNNNQFSVTWYKSQYSKSGCWTNLFPANSLPTPTPMVTPTNNMPHQLLMAPAQFGPPPPLTSETSTDSKTTTQYSLPIATAREMFQNIAVNGMTKTFTSTFRTPSCLNNFQRCGFNIPYLSPRWGRCPKNITVNGMTNTTTPSRLD